jgi:hypothetical protein
MKRPFLTLLLSCYLLAFAAPFVASAEDTEEATWTTDGLCGEDAYEFDSSGSVASEDEEYQSYMTLYEKNITSHYDSNSCGSANAYTKLLEKGDCSLEGKIITEISEPIAPNVELDEDTKVITVFQGQCCIAYFANSDGSITCEDVRTIYADTYNNCKSYGVHCSERQWLIAQSGTGLLKLFVKQIYTWGAFSLGTIAVASIVYQGIKISLSGVSGDISDAKTKIFQAVAGLALLFVSSLILYTINPDFFG